MFKSFHWIFGLLILSLFMGRCQKTNDTLSTEEKVDSSTLCVGYYQSEAEAKIQLAKFATSYEDLKAWKKRSENIKQGILRGAGLDHPPKKCSLNTIVHSMREYNGYTVENVAFESLPGFFVTGNIYRPLGSGPFAGVLCPHGHFRETNGGGRFRPDLQYRCAMFARMGAVVFAYDMIGWGESDQCSHDHPMAVALQTWNSIRSIDFLISLKDVDPNRLGVTGASGGGTQTFLLAAVDDRVAVSVPVVQVSAHFFGGCICESGMPIHKSSFHVTNNADIAALAAPRPQLIISDGDDWTQNTPSVEFPYIQNVYRLFDSESRVENLHFAEEKHDYGESKRLGVYTFFSRHLGLALENVINESGCIDESPVRIENREVMLVFDSEHPRPAHAVTGDASVKNVWVSN